LKPPTLQELLEDPDFQYSYKMSYIKYPKERLEEM